MLAFLAIALLGLVGFASVENFTWWLLCRLAFGGGLGMFFRVVEYWLNTTTHQKNRGLVIGAYTVCFLIGIAAGSLIQPSLGSTGILIFALVGLPIFFGGGVLLATPFQRLPRQGKAPSSLNFLKSVIIVAPLAMAGVMAYGMFEDVPAYLLSVYSLQLGMTEDIAAYTLTAYAVGNLLLAVPLGAVSDKIGRTPVMLSCAGVGLVGATIIPFCVSNPVVYLGLLAIWGGCIGGLYTVSLAYIGDRFSDDELIAANAAFGTIYAAAAMVGPLINGTAMQLWKPHGLMLSCAAIFMTFLTLALAMRMFRQRTETQRSAL